MRPDVLIINYSDVYAEEGTARCQQIVLAEKDHSGLGVVGQEFHSLYGREDVSDGRWISGG